MSSIVKDILIRSTAASDQVHARNKIKEKLGARIQLRPHPRPIRWARSARCHGSSIEPAGSSPGSRLRAEALLTPVSDPTSTTNKVRIDAPYVCVLVCVLYVHVQLYLFPILIHANELF